jgi:hypothetical protein
MEKRLPPQERFYSGTFDASRASRLVKYGEGMDQGSLFCKFLRLFGQVDLTFREFLRSRSIRTRNFQGAGR